MGRRGKEMKFIPGKGYLTVDEKGKKSLVCKIIRPITDPEWNRERMGTRVRKSKKDRLRERRSQSLHTGKEEL